MRQNSNLCQFRTAVFKAFVSLIRPLWGSGIGKIAPIGAIYRYLYHNLAVNEVATKIHGIKMIIRTLESDGISHELLYNSTHEKYETKLFRQFVTEGMTVVDIGANIGYYTLLAAKLVGDKGKVFAFEPEPENYALLVRNIEMNGYDNVVAVRKAVSSKTGKTALFLNREAGAHGFLPDREGVIGKTTVETVSLDEYFEDKECPIDIVKIDVEGSEVPVLMGMQGIIKANDNLRVFTELFWPKGSEKLDFSPQKYWDKLIKSGFKYIYLINEQEQRLELAYLSFLNRYCEDELTGNFLSPNLLCAKLPLK
jgi:FkbM family methyltransferase